MMRTARGANLSDIDRAMLIINQERVGKTVLALLAIVGVVLGLLTFWYLIYEDVPAPGQVQINLIEG